MPSTLTEAQENKLFEDGFIIFDTCGLLDFYYLTSEYQKIIVEIIDHLKEQIWIPAQVKYEFDKNYSNARLKPKIEKYNDKTIQKNNIVDDLKTYISLWDRKYYHPYISDEKLRSLKSLLNKLKPLMLEIKTLIATEYQVRKKEIDEIQNDDIIKQSIDSLNIGNPFSYKDLKDIVVEGFYRYKNQIPPGYKDAETKEGIRQYGDLIIWKEILRKAKEANKDVVFISNDLKADWRIVDETASNNKTEKPDAIEKGKPRRELLTEFEEETGRKIWFYTTAEFICKLEELYKPSYPQIEFYNKLGVVRDVMEQRNRERNLKLLCSEDSILVKCDKCGELFAVNRGDLEFNWEGGQIDDRGMGPENEYVSEETCTCQNCHDEKYITLHVWEYPLGSFNCQNIEIEGGDIEKPIDLSQHISFDEYEECIRCGEYAILNTSGLCDTCQDEFDRFVNSDD